MATGEATSLRADRGQWERGAASEHLTALTIEDTRSRTTGEGGNAMGVEQKSRREFNGGEE